VCLTDGHRLAPSINFNLNYAQQGDIHSQSKATKNFNRNGRHNLGRYTSYFPTNEGGQTERRIEIPIIVLPYGDHDDLVVLVDDSLSLLFFFLAKLRGKLIIPVKSSTGHRRRQTLLWKSNWYTARPYNDGGNNIISRTLDNNV
jgi:hypothetical protein